MTDHLTENARLREALAYYADQFCEGFCNDLPEAGTYHISMDDRCSGCKARAALATPAPDAVQEAARVPEVAALIEAAKVLHTNAVATKARTIGGVCGQTIDCMLRSTFHQASIYDLDALSDALRAITEGQ